MGEEEGLVGSYSYVRRASAAGTLGQIKYMINTDMSLNPTQLELWGGDPDGPFFEALSAEINKIDPVFERYSTDEAAASQSSDSQAFIEQGVPTGYLKGIWPKDVSSCVHADCDTIRWVTPEGMKHSAVVGAMLIAALGDSNALVARRFDKTETAKFYKDQNIKPSYRGPAPSK
jgi:hypothetical protein